MKPFRVSPTVTFPANAATSTFAFLGTRGSGKSYGAGVLVEAFLAQQVQVVVVDLVGTWWGLRLAANGKSKGFDIPVFGGIHGDVPLEAAAGALVAQLIVERGLSMVLDVSDFTIGQQRRFVTDLAREIFQLKKRHPSPLHLVFEEGHELFPQFVDASAAQLVGATTRLWKIGRNYGIGGTIITQRAAETNKSALNLTDRIVTGQLRAPEDIKRIDGWANSNGVSDAMVEELPKLPKGTLIVWEETGAVKTVFDAKSTFDASRTPDGIAAKAQKLAPIDLDAVREAMRATIEESKANDPKALRAKVAELEKRLHETPSAQALAILRDVHAWTAEGPLNLDADDRRKLAGVIRAIEMKTARTEKPVLKEADLKRLEKLAERLEAAQLRFGDRLAESWQKLVDSGTKTCAQWEVAHTELRTAVDALAGVGRKALQLQGVPVSVPRPQNGIAHTRGPRDGRPIALAASASSEDSPLPAVTQRMLGALRQGEAMGYTSMAFRNVAHIAGVSPSSGTTVNRKGLLMKGGYITSTGNHVALTDRGRAYPISVELPPTDRAGLLAFWKREIGTEKVCRILDYVVTQGRVANDDLAAAVEMSADSGTFSNYKSVLIGRGLITRSGRDYVPAEVFNR